MISLRRSGKYRIIEGKDHIKILYLDNEAYPWVRSQKIGEILTHSHTKHPTVLNLAIGRYRMYDVEDEPLLIDTQHLELECGPNMWQGYLLITGLPTEQKIRSRIIPTSQIITGNSNVAVQMGLARVDGLLPRLTRRPSRPAGVKR